MNSDQKDQKFKNFTFEPKLPWLDRIPQEARYSSFAIGFILLFIAYVTTVHGTTESVINYIVIPGFLLVVFVLMIPYIFAAKKADVIGIETASNRIGSIEEWRVEIDRKIKSLEKQCECNKLLLTREL